MINAKAPAEITSLQARLSVHSHTLARMNTCMQKTLQGCKEIKAISASLLIRDCLSWAVYSCSR
jgi:hypothetical protein